MTFLIAIAGGSGSGKTTLARALADALPPEKVGFLSEDWYFADVGAQPGFDASEYDFDDLQVRDHVRLAHDLHALRRGEPVWAPAYSFHEHRRIAEHATAVEPRPILIAEGAHLLCTPAVAALFHLKVFVDTPPDVRFIRRLIRDQAERGRSAQSVIDQYLKTVRPAHLRLIDPSSTHADVVIPDHAAKVTDADAGELHALIAPLLAQPGLQAALA
ncbi:uridine kinase [soil metagenome]